MGIEADFSQNPLQCWRWFRNHWGHLVKGFSSGGRGPMWVQLWLAGHQEDPRVTPEN